MADLVSVSTQKHVADVRLNRPDHMNALNIEMMNAVANVIKDLYGDNRIRVVVLSGAGKGFCAGLDYEEISALQSQEGEQSLNLTNRYEDRVTNIAQFIAYGWKQLPMPVIASIHGFALGGGCQIALGADIRFATTTAKFSIMETKWGLIPDMSASQTIRDLVPIDVAKELIFTGKTISGDKAAELNLVTRTCDDPYAEAMELAADIAEKSPHAVRAAKKLLNETWHGDSAPGLLMESALEMSLIGQPNHIEAINANFEKRIPRFTDPD
jgi:enoyl-CoA hydratase/carnithine racemase